MDEQSGGRFTSMSIGLNADSLATWFPKAVQPFLIKEPVLLDIRVDDQDRTHDLLKDGDVVGCISSRKQPLQGCRVAILGRMNYHMTATAGFAAKWFPDGMTLEKVRRAPAILFNRKDELHHKLLLKVFGKLPDPMPIHYIPSSEKFADFITMGSGYGMLPTHQSNGPIREGRLIDLMPGQTMEVTLYWHCWNLKSDPLDKFTRQLIIGAKKLLEK